MFNLKQHLEEIDKRFDEEFSLPPEIGDATAGIDYIPPRRWTISNPEAIKFFIHAEAIELVKKAFEETQLQEADRTVVDDNILQQLTVNGITIGWNDARSAILEKQNLYLNEKTEK